MPAWFEQPPLPLAALFVAGGFYVLLTGADLLVKGAVRIAKRTGLSNAVIGATVVAFGTSLPELVVSIGSLMKAADPLDPNGTAVIAVSNVVGSNIFNIAAILGLASMFRALPVPRSTIRLDYPLMLLAFGLLIFFSLPLDGPARIERVEGGILFALLVAFTVIALRTGKVDTSEMDEGTESLAPMLPALGLVLLGVIMLAGGGELALRGAVQISREIGISERVIGLTVMAIGTSLPELATSAQAARQGHTDIAVANVVGSNIFNVFCIVGVAGMISPLPVSEGTIGWDYVWMGGFGLLLLPLMLRGRKIRRGEGVLLMGLLIAYVVLLIQMPDLRLF